MMEKRSQGRPCRGDNEVGRLRIVDSLQQMLRDQSFEDLSRKSIAKHIGVTPALITYYFPSRESLIEEATKPIIEAYSNSIRTIIYSNLDTATKLSRLVRTLVDAYRYDAGILKAYSDLVSRRDKSSTFDYLELISSDISVFLTELLQRRPYSAYDLAALQGAIWGMCASVARMEWTHEQIDTSINLSFPCEADYLTPVLNLLNGGLGFNGLEGAPAPRARGTKTAARRAVADAMESV